MLKNIAQCEFKTETRYFIAYDDAHGTGYGFDCDEHGNPSAHLTDVAKANLEWCKVHSEKFLRAGEVVAFQNTYVVPAHGTCVCGEDVTLEDQYLGACKCPKCGCWYNLFGESILPPNKWFLGDE